MLAFVSVSCMLTLFPTILPEQVTAYTLVAYVVVAYVALASLCEQYRRPATLVFLVVFTIESAFKILALSAWRGNSGVATFSGPF